jgi:hypothetical protein
MRNFLATAHIQKGVVEGVFVSEAAQASFPLFLLQHQLLLE